jgi:hypothetical protein
MKEQLFCDRLIVSHTPAYDCVTRRHVHQDMYVPYVRLYVRVQLLLASCYSCYSCYSSTIRILDLVHDIYVVVVAECVGMLPMISDRPAT